MLRLHHVVLSLPLIVSSSVQALSADPPAMIVLKEKGLTRSGRIFVIEAEDPVLEKSSMIRRVLAEFTATVQRQNEAELAARDTGQLEERRVVLQRNFDQLDQQINQQGFQQGNMRQGGFGQAAYFESVDLAARTSFK